jgi:phosphonate transport system substrate-binding protein
MPDPKRMKSRGPRWLRWKSAGFILAGLILYCHSSALAQKRNPLPDDIIIAYNYSAFSDVTIQDVQIALELWSNQLKDKMKGSAREVLVDILEGPQAIDQALSNEQLDVVILGPLDYFMLDHRDVLEPLLAPQTAGKVTQRYYLVVPRGVFKRLIDLEHKELIVFAGGQGTLPFVWLDTQLLKEGLPQSQEFFKSVRLVEKASEALHPVFFGQSDACVITDRSFDTLCELNPQINARLVSLIRSAELLRGFVCFRRGLDDTLKQETKRIMLDLHTEPEGSQILMMFREERLVPYEERYLEQNLLLHREYLAMAGSRAEKR